MKNCVQSAGMLSEFLMSNVGLSQVLSPMLFSLCVNDFEAEFFKKRYIVFKFT